MSLSCLARRDTLAGTQVAFLQIFRAVLKYGVNSDSFLTTGSDTSQAPSGIAGKHKRLKQCGLGKDFSPIDVSFTYLHLNQLGMPVHFPIGFIVAQEAETKISP